LGDLFLDLMLDGGRAIGAEVRRDLLREPVLELAEGSRQRAPLGREGALELALDLLHHAARLLDQVASGLARGALELRAHIIDLRPNVLSVQNPGADLDRVGDRARRLLAGLGPLADHARSPLVTDGEALDHQPVVERPHDALAVAGRLVEW